MPSECLPINRVLAAKRLYRGFSMIEVIVAAVIFATAAAGVMATVSITSTPAVNNEARLKGASFGKKVLDTLSKAVKSGMDTSGALTVGPHVYGADPDGDFPGYTANYVVSIVGGQRKVDITVAW